MKSGSASRAKTQGADRDMAGDWSRIEVEAIVDDYFAMLSREVRQVPYNKAEHRRRLQALLDHRTDGSIERKHQNISAVLIECGFAYISGYKPLSNYQELLREVVVSRLSRATDLTEIVRTEVERPAPAAAIPDTLALEEPPTVPPFDFSRVADSPACWDERRAYRTDFLALEARNRSLGGAGEDFVVAFEIARLRRLGEDRLADRVERVSATRGDGFGFDVLSFKPDGQELFIEVKTTGFGKETPFFLSRNEIAFSVRNDADFRLYRLFEFRRRPRLFTLSGSLRRTCALQEEQYRAWAKPAMPAASPTTSRT